MGRAGAGGGSRSGGRSSGGHSSSRVSGGHRVGGSGHSRAGSGMRQPAGPPRPSGIHYHGRHPGGPPPYHHRRRIYYGPSSMILSIISSVILAVIAVAVVAVLCLRPSGSSVPASTYRREKVNTGVAYQNNCIVDELGWFDNIPRTERDLQNFYNRTGIQPCIVLKSYDSSLRSDDQKEAFANAWYDDNIDNEGTFLFMYFAEQDADYDVGYMCYVNGKQITSVMDAEAVEIFWAYLDNAWYSDMSTDDMFVTVFDNTAKRIMSKSATAAEIWLLVIAGCVAAGLVVFAVQRVIRRRSEDSVPDEKKPLV